MDKSLTGEHRKRHVERNRGNLNFEGMLKDGLASLIHVRSCRFLLDSVVYIVTARDNLPTRSLSFTDFGRVVGFSPSLSGRW
jgi:hypothetical protein